MVTTYNTSVIYDRLVYLLTTRQVFFSVFVLCQKSSTNGKRKSRTKIIFNLIFFYKLVAVFFYLPLSFIIHYFDILFNAWQLNIDKYRVFQFLLFYFIIRRVVLSFLSFIACAAFIHIEIDSVIKWRCIDIVPKTSYII